MKDAGMQKISYQKMCDRVGMTRQNFYKKRKARQRHAVDTELILEKASEVRREHPELGTRKVHSVIKNELEYAGVSIGRDRLFDIFRENDFLIKPKKRLAKTTNSRHSLPVFTNTFKDMELSGPNQAWVSDITYIRVNGSFIYLSLITDAWSRKIVGWHGGNTLETVGCLRALDMALKGLPKGAFPVHHSDRGCQYCSHVYVNKLRKAELGISMTEENHCYENAMAERVNGILKNEYSLSATFASKRQAVVAINQAINLYNCKRPHLALNFKFPAEVHESNC